MRTIRRSIVACYCTVRRYGMSWRFREILITVAVLLLRDLSIKDSFWILLFGNIKASKIGIWKVDWIYFLLLSIIINLLLIVSWIFKISFILILNYLILNILKGHTNFSLFWILLLILFLHLNSTLFSFNYGLLRRIVLKSIKSCWAR